MKTAAPYAFHPWDEPLGRYTSRMLTLYFSRRSRMRKVFAGLRHALLLLKEVMLLGSACNAFD